MQLFANNAAAKLAAAVADTDTTITVDDASVFPSLGSDDWFLVTLYQETGGVESNHEIVKVTAVDGNDLTVERGQEDTAAQAFDVDDKVDNRNTAETMSDLRDATTTETVATATVNIDRADGGIQELTLTADETISVSMDSGQSLTLHLTDGDSYTVTWPTMTWVGGSAPTLTSADVIEFWQIGSTLYGAYVGSVA